MNLADIASEYGAIGIATIAVLLTLVQISPIKIDPWSKLASSIGKALFKDIKADLSNEIQDMKNNIHSLEAGMGEIEYVKDDVKKINGKINNMGYRLEEHRAIEARRAILQFGDEVSHGQNHSRDHFKQILTTDITFYNQYCLEHPEFKNDMTKITSERIEEDYKSRDKENNFL